MVDYVDCYNYIPHKKSFEQYKASLITFSIKDFEILHGPCISLSNIIQKRVKRRNIQLVRKLN